MEISNLHLWLFLCNSHTYMLVSDSFYWKILTNVIKRRKQWTPPLLSIKWSQKIRNLRKTHIVFYLNWGVLLSMKCSYSPAGVYWVERGKVHMWMSPFTWNIPSVWNLQLVGTLFKITVKTANASAPSSLLAYLLPPLECTKIFTTSLESPVTVVQPQVLIFFFLLGNSIT